MNKKPNLVLNAVKKSIHDHPATKILVAASGGHDSMVLIDALQKTNIKFACAHCNYQLRGIESDLDAEFLRDYCQSRHIPFYLKIHSLNDHNQSNIQEEARIIRHEFFNEILEENDFDYLMTGHHVEDRLETFILNFSRGSGINGLSSMPHRSKHIVRPFIKLTKAELNEYALQNHVAWREDSSNKENFYTRNKLRNQIIPLLKDLNPSFITNGMRSIDNLQDVQQYLSHHRREWRSHNTNTMDGIVYLDIHHTIEDFFLFEYLAELGFHHNTIDEIKKNINLTGRKYESHNGTMAIVNRNQIIITQPDNERNVLTNEYKVNERQSAVELPQFILHIDRIKGPISPDQYTHQKSSIAYMDESKIKYPLCIRTWSPGDRFKPLGMSGKIKKVQDLLIDKKINLIEKKNIYVLTSENKIIWVLNLQMAEFVKITNQSKNIIRFEVLPKKS